MRPNNTVAFYTLGCKLNFSETSAIASQLENDGFARVDFDMGADVYVINTCSVTNNADKKCRNIIRKAKRKNPDAFVAVIGCYAQLKPKEITEINGVNIVLGAQEKFNILEHIRENNTSTTGEYIAGHIKEVKTFHPAYSRGDRTRTFLKVQDGCDYFCSFCTIPLARGRSRNASIDKTLSSAKSAIADGAKEIVLTGVNIGDFGKSTGEDFFSLVKALDQLEGVERFRISSIEPNLLSNAIIEFVAQSKKFVPHFHIPLQSGSDALLKQMRRRYDTDLYTERIEKIKSLMPDCCIGVDVIVGSPGETEAHFETTYKYLRDLDISYLHVFTYSERANTPAARKDNAVPMEVRHKRSKMLRILSTKKKRAFYQSQLKAEREVLWEDNGQNGFMTGYTENYVKVKAPYNAELTNTVQPVYLESIGNDNAVLVEQLTPEPA